MSKTRQTIKLNGEPRVIRFSNEHDGPQYFDKDDSRLAWVDDQAVKYKPEYDFETRSVKHWWFKNESELFRDVHVKIATFRTRTAVGKYWKALRLVLADKYIWRHISPNN